VGDIISVGYILGQSFEPLIGVVVFLVLKLWQNDQNFG